MLKRLFSFAVVLGMQAVSATALAKEPRILLLTPFVNYAFFEPVKKGARDAAQALHVEATFDGIKDGNVTDLAAKIRQGVADGYDGIAILVIDPSSLDAAIAEAVKKGVSVIAFNVDDNRTPNARMAFVGQNMIEAGHTFGHRIADSIPAYSQVLLTMHDPNISALEDRARGIKEVLKSRNLQWTELITSTDREVAAGKILATLKANPEIKTIIGTGSADTEAAGLVIERQFSKSNYVCAGFDLTPDILRLIKAGVLRFSIDQQPYSQGYYSVLSLTLHRRYGLLPANIDTGAAVITADDVDQVLKLSEQHYR